MTSNDYIRILMIGYREYINKLSNYLIRESKKAEKEFIDNEEFFDGLNNGIKILYNDIDYQYYKRVNEVSIIKDLRLEKGQSIEDLEGHVTPREFYNVHLPRVTNNLFAGNLPYQDILLLESKVQEAQESITIQEKITQLESAKTKVTNLIDDLSESEHWAKLIAKRSPYEAQRLLFQWQGDYNREKPFNQEVWKRHNNHFLALFQNSNCNDVAYELEKSEKDFEYACLAYWKNTKKEVNSAITDISNAIAVIKILEWLEAQNPKTGSSGNDNKSQSETASKEEVRFKPKDKILLSKETIEALHEFCKNNDFFESDFEYSDFFNCFNLSKAVDVYPNFKRSYQQKFVLLIKELVTLTNYQAKERFNISSYSNIIDRIENDTKPSALKEKMKVFVNRYKPGINNI